MATLKSQHYKDPSVESRVGNVNADVLEYDFTGAEAAADVVKLRKMGEYNNYLRMKVVNDAAFFAGTTIDVGYLSREDGVASDDDYFAAALDIVAAQEHDLIVGPMPVGLKHDLTITINANNVANAGKNLKIVTEFINTAG